MSFQLYDYDNSTRHRTGLVDTILVEWELVWCDGKEPIEPFVRRLLAQMCFGLAVQWLAREQASEKERDRQTDGERLVRLILSSSALHFNRHSPHHLIQPMK